MKQQIVKRTLQAAAAGALLPLLAFCSPGDAATSTAAATPHAPEFTGAATIFINEILAHTDEPEVDTLELYNPGSAAVDLRGWCISDDKDDLRKYCIPGPTGSGAPPAIVPGGYFLVTAPELGFAFSEFGEEVFLSAPDGSGGMQRIDTAEFGASPNGFSLGRHVSSTGAVEHPLQSQKTLGAPNAGPLIPAVVISGIAYNPAQGPEYLVLTNNSGAAVGLFDPLFPANPWQVSGIGDNGGEYPLPPQTTLLAGESIVITADPADFAATYPALALRVFGPFEGRLNNDGERIELLAPQPPETDGKVAYIVLDAVEYETAAPWPPAGASGQALVRKDLLKFGNDPANWDAAAVGVGGGSAKVLLPLVRR